jgi:hypothetical protein
MVGACMQVRFVFSGRVPSSQLLFTVHCTFREDGNNIGELQSITRRDKIAILIGFSKSLKSSIFFVNPLKNVNIIVMLPPTVKPHLGTKAGRFVNVARVRGEDGLSFRTAASTLQCNHVYRGQNQ